MEQYLKETELLDYSNENIKKLVDYRLWRNLDKLEAIKEVYYFVKDEILFGYNVDDKLQASRVLSDGIGQCNTKAILLMALLRSLEIPCRIHGFTVRKSLQKGVMSPIVYKLAPNDVFHSWAEVFYENKWYALEGVILDKGYLSNLQKKLDSISGAYEGYAVGVKDFKNPPIDFEKNSTYIQSESVNNDLGVYDSPDELLENHKQNIKKFKTFMYRNIGRHMMNRRVKKIRRGK